MAAPALSVSDDVATRGPDDALPPVARRAVANRPADGAGRRTGGGPRFVTYNIRYGLGVDGRYDLDRIAGELTGADVIALQEVERFWRRSGLVDQPAELARLLGNYYWVYGANMDVDASHRDSRGRLINRRRQFGTMILSRTPILSSRNFPLPKRALTTQHSIQQGLLEAVIATGAPGPLRVYSAHLSHLGPETRLPQVDAVSRIVARAPREGGAWCGDHPDPDAGWTEGGPLPMPRGMILAGDLNFEPDSVEYDRLLDPAATERGRTRDFGGLVDAWDVAGNGRGDATSHPDHAARIDHIFVSECLAARVDRCWIDETARGSDHRPVWMELSAAAPS